MQLVKMSPNKVGWAHYPIGLVVLQEKEKRLRDRDTRGKAKGNRGREAT